MKPYWIVWHPADAWRLKKIYDSEHEARNAAARLAEENPGEEFTVLRSVAQAACYPKARWTEFPDKPLFRLEGEDAIPF